MNKVLASLVFIILTVGLIVTLMIFYKVAGNTPIDKALLKENFETKSDKELIKEANEDSWIDKFAKKDSPTYRFPATEIFIEFDLNKDVKAQALYKILIDKLDDYQFFLLSRVIKEQSQNIEYSYFKQDNTIKLIIMTSIEDSFKTLLNELDNYSIEYNLEK